MRRFVTPDGHVMTVGNVAAEGNGYIVQVDIHAPGGKYTGSTKRFNRRADAQRFHDSFAPAQKEWTETPMRTRSRPEFGGRQERARFEPAVHSPMPPRLVAMEVDTNQLASQLMEMKVTLVYEGAYQPAFYPGCLVTDFNVGRESGGQFDAEGFVIHRGVVSSMTREPANGWGASRWRVELMVSAYAQDKEVTRERAVKQLKKQKTELPPDAFAKPKRKIDLE